MRLRWFPCLAGVFCAVTFAQTTVGVGGGAPTPAIGQQFVNAFNRNGFDLLVAATPLGAVGKFGSTGLIQQFQGASNSAALFALVKPDTSSTDNVYQVLALMFAFYNGIGPTTAGYPTNDTLPCPPVPAFSGNSCQWQPFSLNHALFAYKQPLPGGEANFATRDPFFTKWMSFGGVTGLGPATTA